MAAIYGIISKHSLHFLSFVFRNRITIYTVKEYLRYMKKGSKKYVCRIVPLLLCAAVLVAVAVAVAVHDKTRPATEIGAFVGENGKSVERIAEKLSLDAELVKASCMGSVAKIDIVTSGLDVCTVRVALLDLKSGDVLSETELPEGAWITGQTENGFYAVEQSKKTLYIYDNSGKLKYKNIFSDNEEWSSVCAVSEDERYFVYTLAKNGAIYVFDRDTCEEKMLVKSASLQESLGFSGGIMYAVGTDNTVIVLDIANSSVRTEVCDKRLNIYSPFYGIGTTETGFIAVGKTEASFIPFDSSDEITVGIGESGFVTAASDSKGSKLRIYNLKNKTVAEASISDAAENACYTGDGRLLVVAGDAKEKKHSLYLCNIRDLPEAQLSVTAADIPEEDKAESTASEKEEPESSVPENREPQSSVSETKPPQSNAAASSFSESITLTGTKNIGNVPIIAQRPEFPSGCESVSAVMVLKYFGEAITVGQFIDDYLPKSNEFYYENDKRYGPSPYEYFIGSPRASSSYGCMAPVIEKAISGYFGSSERVKNTTGTELAQLCKDYIDNDIPVMVWATINMINLKYTGSWYLNDGTYFTWPGNEHCLVLTGYDESYYYFNDPYQGKALKFAREKVEDRFAALGKQSVVVTAK